MRYHLKYVVAKEMVAPSFLVCLSSCLYYYNCICCVTELYFITPQAKSWYALPHIIAIFTRPVHLMLVLKMKDTIVRVCILLKCLVCFCADSLTHTNKLFK